jgi:hypothetical protein
MCWSEFNRIYIYIYIFPRYLLGFMNFGSGDPYQTSVPGMITYPLLDPMYFVKCEKPINSPYHLNISACIEDGVYSNSKRYTYALVYRSALELGDLCQVEQISLTPRSNRYYDDDLRNISCTARLPQ